MKSSKQSDSLFLVVALSPHGSKTPKCGRNVSKMYFVCVLLLLLVYESEASWWLMIELPVHCNRIPGLVQRQKNICQKNTELISLVAKGIALGIKECQFQFKYSRWNCSLSSLPRRRSNRETSFVSAIQSAAVVHFLTRSCHEGNIEGCACDSSKKGQHHDTRGQFTWGGCSDNIRFSSSFARKFIDASEKFQRDVTAQTILHNKRVGRKSIRKKSHLQCKCHGVSGSCSYRTCWLKVSPLRLVGRWLKKRYDRALHVSAEPDGSGFLLVSNKRTLKKFDLVYLEPSPDYCQEDAFTGIAGTAGRECNATSTGQDSCSKLCCGNGYYTEPQLLEFNCQCKFHWCCHVKCQKCQLLRNISYCNSL